MAAHAWFSSARSEWLRVTGNFCRRWPIPAQWVGKCRLAPSCSTRPTRIATVDGRRSALLIDDPVDAGGVPDAIDACASCSDGREGAANAAGAASRGERHQARGREVACAGDRGPPAQGLQAGADRRGLQRRRPRSVDRHDEELPVAGEGIEGPAPWCANADDSTDERGSAVDEEGDATLGRAGDTSVD